MSSSDALEVARENQPETREQSDPKDPQGLKPGDTVSVVADLDSGEAPVFGKVRFIDCDSIAIVREDTRVGAVCVHFPRVGYRVTVAADSIP